MWKSFRIFSSNPAINSCLKVVEQGIRATIGSYEECIDGGTRDVYWQWWHADTNHLRHVLTGLCLSALLPPSSIRRAGFAAAVLEKCVVGNVRQVSENMILAGFFLDLHKIAKSWGISKEMNARLVRTMLEILFQNDSRFYQAHRWYPIARQVYRKNSDNFKSSNAIIAGG